MNKDKFIELLNSYCNGTATKEEFDSMEDAMLSNEEFRLHYLSFMTLDSALRSEAEKSLTDEPARKNTIKPLITIFITLAAAIVILLTLNLTYLFKNNESTQLQFPTPEPLQKGLAIVTKSIGIKDANIFLENGSTVEKGLLQFQEGLVQLEMFSGVTLLIEGPVKLDLQDTMNISLINGKIRARVPEPAHGFKIKTDNAKIVDLGTEFGVNVDESGKSDLYVYEGEVEFHPDSSQMKNLKSNQGVSWLKEDISAIPVIDNIVNFQNVETMHDDFTRKKLNKWKEYADTIRSRDDVILFYTFEEKSKWSRSIQNESLNPASSLNGAIVGCKWSEGRWPGKGALEFKNTSDRIRLNIPGEYKNMTFSCWVRIEGFDRWLSSLLLTDNYLGGALHWQLSDAGEIILGANSNGNTFSKKVIQPEDLGRWLHIVTVYNSDNREIVHYLNGKPVIRDQIEKLQTIRLGNCEIGNWHCSPGTGHAIRSLNGRLDEFIIYSSALNDKQIQQIYTQGIPQ